MSIFTKKANTILFGNDYNIFSILGIEINKNAEQLLKIESNSESRIQCTYNFKDNFNIFEVARLFFFENKVDLSGNTFFNIIMFSKSKNNEISNVKNLIDSIACIYGKDSNGLSEWTKKDKSLYLSNSLVREWIVDKYGHSDKEATISLNCVPSIFGLQLCILRANQLVI